MYSRIDTPSHLGFRDTQSKPTLSTELVCGRLHAPESDFESGYYTKSQATSDARKGEMLQPVTPGFNRPLRVEIRVIQTEDSVIPRAAGVVSGVL